MADVLFTRFKEENLEAIARNSGFEFSDTFFIYPSGQIGNYYVNSENIMKSGRDYADAITALNITLSRIVPNSYYDVISGGGRKDFIFSYPVAVGQVKPHLALYKDGSSIGADIIGKSVVHVSHLNDGGDPFRDFWIPMIKDLGGKIRHVFFYVDRMENGVKVIEELGLERHAIVPLDEGAWNYLLKLNVIDNDIYQEIRKRMEDREEWARRVLRSDKGFKQFVEYLMDVNTRKSAKKTMHEGYPDLKGELLERLKEEHRSIVDILYC